MSDTATRCAREILALGTPYIGADSVPQEYELIPIIQRAISAELASHRQGYERLVSKWRYEHSVRNMVPGLASDLGSCADELDALNKEQAT